MGAVVLLKNEISSLACSELQAPNLEKVKTMKVVVRALSSIADSTVSAAFFLYESFRVISSAFVCEVFAKVALVMLAKASFLSLENPLFSAIQSATSATLTAMAVSAAVGCVLAVIGFSVRYLEYYLALLEIKKMRNSPFEQIDLEHLRALLHSFPWGLLTEKTLEEIREGLKEIEKKSLASREIEDLVPELLEREEAAFFCISSFADTIYKMQALGQKIGLSYIPPFQRVCKEAIRLVPSHFRKEASLRSRTYTHGELQRIYPEVNRDTLINMYRKMHRRVSHLGQDEQIMIDAYVKENLMGEDVPQVFQKASLNCGQAHIVHYNFLLLNLNQDANFFNLSLVNILEGGLDSMAKQESIQLYTILYALNSFPETILEGELFSQKEEALLRFSASMRNCKRGRIEAIEVFYNYLLVNYPVLSQKTARVSQDDKVKDFVYTTCFVELANQFNGATPFVKERTGVLWSVSELSHQSNFLKNLIGNQVGLKKVIEKDPYAFTLYSKIYGKSPIFTLFNLRLFILNNLESFYKCFTPQTVVDAVKREFNRRELKEKYALVEPINLLLDRYLSSKGLKTKYGVPYIELEGVVEVEKMSVSIEQVSALGELAQTGQVIWELETVYDLGPEYGKCLLTEYGAFLLVEALGYIQRA